MFRKNSIVRKVSTLLTLNNIYLKTLNDGNTIPLFGLGCYKIGHNDTLKSVLTAINSGYKLIDTAESYENEKFVGEAIKVSGIKREDIFIATKLSSQHGYEKTLSSCLESLKKLDIEYIDLYLIHSPSKGRIIETWSAFQKLKEDGFVKSIGVSNFNVHHLEGLKNADCVVPTVNQIEHHPWYQQRKLVQYCKQQGISVMGYCPLARMQMIQDTRSSITVLCEKYTKTKSQILLRWSLQKDVITIPKSIHVDRINENIDIFDFELRDHEMFLIDQLDENHQIASINAINEPWTG